DLKRGEIARLLGFALPDTEVVRVLAALQFKVEPTTAGWKVTPPPTRLDIQVGAADLIEELARVSGYDRLPEGHLTQPLPQQKGNRSLQLEDKVRDLLADAGVQEVVTYSLSSPDAEARLHPGKGPAADCVTLLNPISPERSVMRRSLLPGVLAVAA